MRLRRWDAEFDVHLVDDMAVPVRGLERAADIEEALAGERIGRVVDRLRGWRHG